MVYTEEELIEELQRVSEEHCNGEAPKQKDMKKFSTISYPTFTENIGSWSECLDRSGIENDVVVELSKEQLLTEINRVYEKHGSGGTVTANQMREHGKYSIVTYYDNFNSWNDALEKVDLNAGGRNRYTDEYLLNLLEDVAEEIPDNEIINTMHIKNYTKHGFSTYIDRFGSFYKALSRSPINLDNHIEKSLLSEIKRLQKELNRVPTQKDMTKHGNFAVNTYYRKIGSYNGALKKSGFEVNYNTYTKQQITSEIERLSQEFFDGGSPTQNCFMDNTEMSLETVFNKFGTWNNALEEMGFKRNGAGYNAPSGEDHPHWKEGYDKYYGDSWYFKRKECLKRDNKRCRVCGSECGDSSYFDNPDVHHINPQNNWDVEEEHEEMNDLSNLICLCRSCHRPLEGKWQDSSPEEFAERGRELLDIEE